MKKNDDTIQKLFDDYAEDLTERSDLAQKAKDALAEKNAQVAPKTKQRKPNFWTWFAPVCAALIIVVVSFSIWLPKGTVGEDGNGGDTNVSQGEQSNQSAQINYYALSDVKGRSVAPSDFESTLNITKIKEDESYQVVYERYYAFYFEDGTLAYLKAVLGVRSDEGFCEIVIVAESDGYVRKDLRDVYDCFLDGSTDPKVSTHLGDKGEYVTNAYFNARSSHFYVYATTGANGSLAQKIIEKIV